MEWVTTKQLIEGLVRGHGVGFASQAKRAVYRRAADGSLRARAVSLAVGADTAISNAELPASFWQLAGSTDLFIADWSIGDFDTFADASRRTKMRARGVQFSGADAQLMGANFDVPVNSAEASEEASASLQRVSPKAADLDSWVRKMIELGVSVREVTAAVIKVSWDGGVASRPNVEAARDALSKARGRGPGRPPR